MSSLSSVALGALLLSACSSWQVQAVPPQQALLDPQYLGKTLRLTTVGNDHIVLRQVRLRGEQIIGLEGYSPTAIPLVKVREVATKHFSPGRTVGLIAGTAVALGLALLAAIASGGK